MIDREHSDYARAQGVECGSFYMESAGQSFPCSCGYVESKQPFVQLTTDEWEQKYDPQDGPDGSLVWEFPQLSGIPENTIWTLVDGDNGGLYALPGIHMVNVFGFAVTKNPWEQRNIEARYDHDKEDT